MQSGGGGHGVATFKRRERRKMSVFCSGVLDWVLAVGITCM